jgi:acetyltransferase-like isoleucine patch superfamily enzyme
MLSRLILKIGSLPGRILHRARQHELRQVCIAGKDTRFYRSSTIDNFKCDPNSVRIGNGTHVLGQLIVFPHGGRIEIGDDCFIGEHARIWSMSLISIGDRVQISHGVNIHDNNAHSLSAMDRHVHLRQILSGGHPQDLQNVPALPIKIGADAWIGFNATIMAGVTIGKGAIVGACSLVRNDVPEYTIVAGNPARAIGVSKP